MMKPQLVSQTKYFLALAPKDCDKEDPSTIHVLIEKAWIGSRFELFDTDSSSFNTCLQRSISISPDEDSIIWFPTIQEAYQFATLNETKFFHAMEKSGLDIDAFEWQIMNAKTEIHAVASESENNLDEAIAGIALEELKSKMTPAQLKILRNKI